MRKRLSWWGRIGFNFPANQSHLWYAGRVSVRIWQAAVAIVIPFGGLTAAAQNSDVRYGGEPPWGLEKPVHISGKVHRGERFEQAIGRGLSFYLEPTEQGWHFGVNDAGGADMMEGFFFEACHGGEIGDSWRRINIDEPRVGVQQKLSFNLTAAGAEKKSSEIEYICRCASVPNDCFDPETPAQYRARLRESRTRPGIDIDGGGTGVLVITGWAPGPQPLDGLLDFQVDLAFTGGLELWKLRSRYIIPKGYRGFVHVYYNDQSASPAPKSGDFYLLNIPKSGILHTSSDLRPISGDEQYVFSDGTPISASGLPLPMLIDGSGWPLGADELRRSLSDEQVRKLGEDRPDRSVGKQSFFVGTDRQYQLVEKERLRGTITNIALNKPVTLTGTFSGFSNGSTPSSISIVNGEFAVEDTCNADGIYWSSAHQNNRIKINFGGSYLISGAIVQAGNDDVYELRYLGVDGQYHLWWTVPALEDRRGLKDGCVATRPGSHIDLMELPPVYATGIAISAPPGSGDGYYGVTQVGVFGVARRDVGRMRKKSDSKQ
jgi:hypothetical protein